MPDVQRALQLEPRLKDMARALHEPGTTYDSSPAALRVTLTCATQIIPWQLQINEIQGTRNFRLRKKIGWSKVLLAQQAKANPEPELRRALPLNQSADQGQIVAPQPIAGFPDSANRGKSARAIGEGGYAGMNCQPRSPQPSAVGVRQLNHPATYFSKTC